MFFFLFLCAITPDRFSPSHHHQPPTTKQAAEASGRLRLGRGAFGNAQHAPSATRYRLGVGGWRAGSDLGSPAAMFDRQMSIDRHFAGSHAKSRWFSNMTTIFFFSQFFNGEFAKMKTAHAVATSARAPKPVFPPAAVGRE